MRLLHEVKAHRSQNFVPARNLATAACKREPTTRSGVKLASRWAGTGSTCVLFLVAAIFASWIHAFILSICGVPSGKHDTNSPRHHAVSRSHLSVKLAPVPTPLFSCNLSCLLSQFFFSLILLALSRFGRHFRIPVHFCLLVAVSSEVPLRTGEGGGGVP